MGEPGYVQPAGFRPDGRLLSAEVGDKGDPGEQGPPGDGVPLCEDDTTDFLLSHKAEVGIEWSRPRAGNFLVEFEFFDDAVFHTLAEESDDTTYPLTTGGTTWEVERDGFYYVTFDNESYLDDLEHGIGRLFLAADGVQWGTGQATRDVPAEQIVGWNHHYASISGFLFAGETLSFLHISTMTDPVPSYRNLSLRVVGL